MQVLKIICNKVLFKAMIIFEVRLDKSFLNSSLQTRDPHCLVGACEFLADVVFQDFPAELFLQRPEILKVGN